MSERKWIEGPRGGRYYLTAGGYRVYERKSRPSTKGKTGRGKRSSSIERQRLCGSKLGEGKVHRPEWNAKDNRQYEHILISLRSSKTKKTLCKDARRIAAAKVNQTRAKEGRTKKTTKKKKGATGKR